jgi:CDP-diacylglycerol--serine O-phosphatidyltransferase
MAGPNQRGGRDGKPKKRLLAGVRPAPTMITLGNLLCGFGSIVLAMRAFHPPETLKFTSADCIYYAGLLIFLAMVFDVFDGRVARWTKSTSKFGMEMDSLADVVSFGVAPAVLVKVAIDQFRDFPILDRYVWMLLAVYVVCAALRLARYNVEAETGHRDFFFGLPSPAAAGCVASLVVLITIGVPHPLPKLHPPAPFLMPMGWLDDWRSQWAQVILVSLPFIVLCLGILMVSRVHYIHLGDKLLGGRRSLMQVLLLVLGLVLIVMQPEVMLAAAFNGYMLFGLVNEVRYQLFPSTRPAEWVASSEELLQPPGGRPAQDGGAPAPTALEPPPAATTPKSGA